MKEEITILPFPLLPIASKQLESWKCEKSNILKSLLDRLNKSRIQIIKQSIGNGIQTNFVFDLPFEKLLCWRIVSPIHGVLHPDCHLTANKLTIVFGVPPSLNEFEVEIIGISCPTT